MKESLENVLIILILSKVVKGTINFLGIQVWYIQWNAWPIIYSTFVIHMRKIATLCFLLIIGWSHAQQLAKDKEYNVLGIGFYNLENLFDTINTDGVRDTEFTPEGTKSWDTHRYNTKLERMAKVISDLGTDVTPDGIAVLGVCEIENRSVLEDLVAMPAIKKRNYQIIHYDSPDRRGIDVALLYQEKYFAPTSSASIPLVMKEDTSFITRDLLLASGKLDGEEFHFMVSHWPSRRGGEAKSRPKRIAAAQLGKRIIDSLYNSNPQAKMVYMGDLNDDPVNPSIKKHLNAKGDMTDLRVGDLYNPMEKLYKQGIGTLAWRDNWNLFDQLICTSNLIETGNDFSTYKLYKARVFNQPYLKQSKGNFKGYPFRTFVGPNWLNGYSDHFPVYLLLIKEKS